MIGHDVTYHPKEHKCLITIHILLPKQIQKCGS